MKQVLPSFYKYGKNSNQFENRKENRKLSLSLIMGILVSILFVNTLYSQSNSFLIDESFRDTPLSKVFAKLNTKYQLKIAYDYESIKDIKINKSVRTDNLEAAFTSLFEDTNLEFQITQDHRILIRTSGTEPLMEETPTLFTVSFKGNITDTRTKTPLAYATINCPASNSGCSSDELGNFDLTIQTTKKEGTLTIQYLGYIPRVINWKKDADLSNLKIDLQVKSLDFAEITILEKLPTVSLNQSNGATIFRTNQLNNLPSFIGGKDIFRSLQLLPGISASDDLSAQLKIRGSNGDENIVIMDGITLYKVDHYFGIFSAINSSVIDQVKVYKNAFPVEYGGRTAGVVDLQSHHPIAKSKIQGGVQLDLLTSSAYITLPISNKMGLLVGGRTTNKNVANSDLFSTLQADQNISEPSLNGNENATNQANLLKENPNFKFYDVNAKWLWQLTSKTNIAASFFKGFDQFDYDYTRTFDTRNTGAGGRKDEVVNIEFFEETSEWDNQGGSIQMQHQWNKKIKSHINLANSKYDERQLINSTLVREITRRPPPDSNKPPPPTKIDTTFTTNNFAYNAIEGKEITIKNEVTLSKEQQLTFGYHLVANQVQFEIDISKQRAFANDVQGKQHAGFLQYDLTKSEQFKIGLGLRSTYYSLTNKNYLSPRINLSYQINDKLSLKASGSRYNQFLRQNYREDRFGRSYDFWVLSEDNPKQFPIASSTQGMLGFNFAKNGFMLDVEAYYKSMDGVTEYVPAQNGFLPGMINGADKKLSFYNGTGLSRGIDIWLKKEVKDYTSWIAYTLSKTTHSFDRIYRGEAFPSQDDRRHQLKWVHQYQYQKFDFAATYIYSSGRPYTDLEKIESQTPREQLRPQDRISHLPSYQRIDVSAGYNFDWGISKARVGLSIFNLLDRENVKYRQYIHSVPNQRNDNRSFNEVTGTEVLMLGFTPNLSFSLDF